MSDSPADRWAREDVERRREASRRLAVRLIDELTPRDRDILLWTPRFGWVRGRFEYDAYAKRSRPYWTNDRERLWGTRTIRDHQPTHWMELPPEPEAP